MPYHSVLHARTNHKLNLKTYHKRKSSPFKLLQGPSIEVLSVAGKETEHKHRTLVVGVSMTDQSCNHIGPSPCSSKGKLNPIAQVITLEPLGVGRGDEAPVTDCWSGKIAVAQSAKMRDTNTREQHKEQQVECEQDEAIQTSLQIGSEKEDMSAHKGAFESGIRSALCTCTWWKDFKVKYHQKKRKYSPTYENTIRKACRGMK